MPVDMPVHRTPDPQSKQAVDNARATELLGHFVNFLGHAET